MIETFSLKNFRCFRELSISPLSRINLITGKNNCGKTAFLEGLFLHLGGTNPELPLNINVFRGVGKLIPNAQEIWGWLFREKDYQKKILLTSYDDKGEKRELTISLEIPASSTFSQDGNASNLEAEKSAVELLSTATDNHQLVLLFHGPSPKEQKSRVSAQIINNQIRFNRDSSVTFIPFPPSIFMATKIRNYAEDAERYSRLEEAGFHTDVIEALAQVEPKLKRFVVSVAAGTPSLRADIGGQKMIPLSYMGEGVNRLLSIILAIPVCQGGLLLIDEIENGIHHSVLDRVFQSIHKLAYKFNVQLLATTHSWECIRAAHKAYAETDIYDFRLFEFCESEDEQKQTKVNLYDQDSLGKIVKRLEET